MKSLQQRIDELKGSIGLNSKQTDQAATAFNYQENRALYEQQANADLQKIQQQTKQKRIETLQGKSELNPKWLFENLNEDAPDVIEAVSIARSFIAAHQDPSWRNSRAHMMIFYGDYGRGKSHIAGAIAHELMQKFETSVLYRQLQTLLEMRVFSYDYQAEDNASMRYREVNQQLLDVDLLILDEVCVNETILKKNAQAWLGNLLRQRKADNKNCILITNHNLDELQNAIGRYCFESLREYETYQVRFEGPSRRKPLHSANTTNDSTSTAYQPNQINYSQNND